MTFTVSVVLAPLQMVVVPVMVALPKQGTGLMANMIPAARESPDQENCLVPVFPVEAMFWVAPEKPGCPDVLVLLPFTLQRKVVPPGAVILVGVPPSPRKLTAAIKRELAVVTLI